MSVPTAKSEGITIVVPCLNEAVTLPLVLEKLNRLRTELSRPVEIIVSDNGSTDNSRDIANRMGARVVLSETRGYGAALSSGILAASHEIVVFADADNTYDFLETPRLLEKIDSGCEFVVGSRLNGDIRPGAMFWLHRYLGTPVLNNIINLLYAPKGSKISDCNSGFRAFRKSSFIKWSVESPGMEFASEMLIKALLAGVAITHVPITLHPDTRDRVPHLKTWRDGMRHLLQIFLYSPEFFNRSGFLLFLIGWLVLLFSLFFGPVIIGPASLFDLHTMMFALLLSVYGQTIWGIGLYIAAKKAAKPWLYQRIVGLGEAQLFWVSVFFVTLCAAIFAYIFHAWTLNNFTFLGLQKETLTLVAVATSEVLFISQCITAHLLKRG